MIMVDMQPTARHVDLSANRAATTLALKLILILLRSDAIPFLELMLPRWRATGTALLQRS
jgi:hypothetical protein